MWHVYIVCRLRWWMVPMRKEKCSLDQESCQTISQSRTLTQKQPVMPTTEPYLQTSVTLSMPGNTWWTLQTFMCKICISVVLTCFVRPQTRRRGLCVQPVDRILRSSSRSDSEGGTLLQPILPWTGCCHGPTDLQWGAGVHWRWVKTKIDLNFVKMAGRRKRNGNDWKKGLHFSSSDWATHSPALRFNWNLCQLKAAVFQHFKQKHGPGEEKYVALQATKY